MHGADIESLKRKYNINREILDFSSNINPKMPTNIEKIVKKSIYSLQVYPDIDYIELRESLGQYLKSQVANCDENNFTYKNIMVGNGATELIFLTMKLMKGRLAIVSPSFGEYSRSAMLSDLDYDEITYEKLIIELQKNTNIYNNIYICNPNNPDGKLREMTELINLGKKNNINIFVDETFMEFSIKYKSHTAMNYNYKNIYVIKAITKFFGMPGLRLGYLWTRDRKFIEEINYIKEPWTVNSFAEEITKEIIKDKDFVKCTREYYYDERIFMYINLSKIKNIEVYESEAAFFLIRIKNYITSDRLKEKMLLDYGILIRDASNFKYLDSKYFRVAIKDREKNISLIKALIDIFN